MKLSRLKKLTILLVCLSPLSAMGQSARSEAQCLAAGKLAEAAAALLHIGQPEEQVLKDMLDPAEADPQRSRAQQRMLDENDTAIVNWVYTIRPTERDARASVYTKCIAGGLGWIDPVKYKAARK